MRSCVCQAIVLAQFVYVFGLVAPVYARAAEGTVQVKPWTVKTSVGLRRYSPISISPGRNRVMFMYETDDLEKNDRQTTMNFVDLQSIEKALHEGGQPLVRSFQIHGKGTRPIVRSVTWSEDGNAVSYFGQDKNGIEQLYVLKLERGSPKQISALKTNPVGVNQVYDGNLVVGDHRGPRRFMSRVSYALDTQALKQIAYRDFGASQVEVHFRGRTFSIKEYNLPTGGKRLWLSPTGDYAIALLAPQKPEWRKLWGVNPRVSAQFILLDLRKAIWKPIVDAPAGRSLAKSSVEYFAQAEPSAVWTNDGRFVFLYNTYVHGEAPVERKHTYIIRLELGTMKHEVVGELDNANVDAKSFGSLDVASSESVTLKSKLADQTLFTRINGRWESRHESLPAPPSALPLVPQITVSLEQGLNVPPRVVARDKDAEVTISSPDPVLEAVDFHPETELTITLADGRHIRAGLILPSIRDGQRRFPIVVQCHGRDPMVFSPDGEGRHVYSAQLLASNGIAVINLPIPVEDSPGELLKPAELEDFSDRLSRSINAAAAVAPVDKNNIGLVGFSRGGYMALYAVTHPGSLNIKAAVIDDAYPGSYDYYLSSAATDGPASVKQMETQFGGPFWAAKSQWLERETTFNMDKVTAAVLLNAHDDYLSALSLEIIGALRLNGVPYEAVVYPEGGHELKAPAQRADSIANSANWLSFWLLGKNPNNVAQADRWGLLRVGRDR